MIEQCRWFSKHDVVLRGQSSERVGYQTFQMYVTRDDVTKYVILPKNQSKYRIKICLQSYKIILQSTNSLSQISKTSKHRKLIRSLASALSQLIKINWCYWRLCVDQNERVYVESLCNDSDIKAKVWKISNVLQSWRRLTSAKPWDRQSIQLQLIIFYIKCVLKGYTLLKY